MDPRTNSSSSESSQNKAEEAALRSSFFTAMRTRAFVTPDKPDTIMLWVGIQTDAEKDEWRVMRYSFEDMHRADGIIQSQILNNKTSFFDALAILGNHEFVSLNTLTPVDKEIEERYPGREFPEFDKYFREIEYFKVVGNINGVGFDRNATPHLTKDGFLFTDGRFMRGEVTDLIKVPETVRTNDFIRQKVGSSAVSDFSAVAAAPGRKPLENELMAAQVMWSLDQFSISVGVLYKSILKTLGVQDDDMSMVRFPSPAHKEEYLKLVEDEVPNGLSRDRGCDRILEDVIPEARDRLMQAKEESGVFTKPYESFLAQCEVYVHLLNGAIKLARLTRSMENPHSTDISLVGKIKESVEKAETRFRELGGTEETTYRLRAWVQEVKERMEAFDRGEKKAVDADIIPAWLPAHLSRYFAQRELAWESMKLKRQQKNGLQLLPVGAQRVTAIKVGMDDAAFDEMSDRIDEALKFGLDDQETKEEPVVIDKFKRTSSPGPK